MIEPDNSILQEHAFYESGNLKLLIPLMKLQSYDVPDDNGDFNGVGLMGLIVVAGVLGILYFRKRKVKKAVSLV